jgi:outer membrane protein assembly factor BamA
MNYAPFFTPLFTPFVLTIGLLSMTAVARESVDSSITVALEQGYWSAHPDSSPQGWEPGPVFTLRSIDVRDERGEPISGFSTREWAGEKATRKNLEALRSAVHAQLRNRGFPFAETNTMPRADSTGLSKVDVVVQVRRGAGFKRGEPIVQGTRTRPEVLRRMALWEEGEDFRPDRIEKGMRRLRRAGYFESAEWTGLYRDSARNVLYPLLVLPDAHASSVGGLLGFDSEADRADRVTGFLDVRLLNMRGTARDLFFSFDSRPGAVREAKASYTEPWILSLPIGARVEASFLQQDTIFQEWNQDLVLFRDLDFTSKVEAVFGAQSNRSSESGTGTTRTRALRSGIRVTFDSRDRVPFTRRGTQAEVGLTGVRRDFSATEDGNGGGPDGDSAYYLVQGLVAAGFWMPTTERTGLKVSARAASNFPLTRLNRGELWEVGGARTLRGYRERAFQTNAYLLGDAEYQVTVGRRGRLFGFVSPGWVNRPFGSIDPRGVLGYGAGMEVAQRDWSVALTYALSPERSLGNGFLHVAVENRF